MPHFYAIAIYRLKEYRAAGVPVLPAKEGISSTKMDMLIYIVFFTAAAASLAIFGFAGGSYLGVALTLGFVWLALSVRGFWAKDDNRWARMMFFFSLFVITGLFAAIAFAGGAA